MGAPNVSESLFNDAMDFMVEAGKLTLQWFNHPELPIDTKGDGSPVTAADLAAETLIRDRIASKYPNDCIIGEEHGESTGTGERTWIIDPIDGTKAFSRGIALYSSLLSIEDEHGPAVSIVNMPALGEVVAAGRGIGCWWNGRRAAVSTQRDLSASIMTSCGFDYWHDPQLAAARDLGMQLRTWGDGFGYALVATGRAEAMVDPVVAHWDIAPMELLLSEAGGTFTALDGRPGPKHGTGLATNGLIHDQLLKAFEGTDPTVS